MGAMFIVQATRNGRQVPSFLLDADCLGIVNAGQAARIALDVLVGVTNHATLRFLEEDLNGNLTATIVGTDILGLATRQDGVSVQYAIYAAPAEASGVTDRDMSAAGRLLALAESGDPAISKGAVTRAAEFAATRGSAFAEGFIEGFWYVGGNRQTDAAPHGYNQTWRKARLAVRS